jgi:hypothetical protein
MLTAFFHICTIKNYQRIVDELLHHVVESGLYDELVTLHVGIVGNDRVNFDKSLSKIIVDYQLPSIKYYEFKTLESLYNFCSSHQDHKVLYFHTKGVSERGDKQGITDWRNLMTYCCIDNYKLCIKELDTVDVAGANWFGTYKYPHFAGNFWWATASYISKLQPPPKTDDRFEAEFWVATGKPKGCCIHSSGINHYNEPYPSNKYVNKLRPWKFRTSRPK